mgnify:CR=1 FL=1
MFFLMTPPTEHVQENLVSHEESLQVALDIQKVEPADPDQHSDPQRSRHSKFLIFDYVVISLLL